MSAASRTTLVGDALKPALLAEGILRETSVQGLYQRSATFEGIVRALETLVHSVGQEVGGFEPLVYLPPVMPRDAFMRTDYLRSFPDLVGSIEIFQGGDKEHAQLLRTADEGGDWTKELTASEVVLASAACHPLYASLTGTLPEEGRQLEVHGFCFRHEPSPEPTRMQVFRMHEYVHVGTPDSAVAHRDAWLGRGLDLLGGLGLPVEKVEANDPFFGRAGRMLAKNQRDTNLKFEIVCPVVSEERPTAIGSANYHLDHFGLPFEIRTAQGEVAHSACNGFGMERITLALLAVHGTDPAAWPANVRDQLWA